MTGKHKGRQGPGNQPEQADTKSIRSASPSKGKAGDQAAAVTGPPPDSADKPEPLFTSAESSHLLQVDLPFHDSSPNMLAIKALEAVVAARLDLFNQVDQALRDVIR